MSYGTENDPTWYDQVTPATPDAGPGPLEAARYMGGQAAGWYRDPLEPALYQRWWDGRSWDEQTMPPGGPYLPRPATRVVRGAADGRALRWMAVAGSVLLCAGVIWLYSARVEPPSDAQSPAPAGPGASAPAGPGAAGAGPLVLAGLAGGSSIDCTTARTAAVDVTTCQATAPGHAPVTVRCERSPSASTCTSTDLATGTSSTSVCALDAGGALHCRPSAARTG